jgi:4'-phosphopantetheinyl transferase EntD
MASGSLLAPGASPMIGRMHEVDDAQRLTAAATVTAAAATAVATVAPPAVAAPPGPSIPPRLASSSRSRRTLPFVGAVEAYQAGRSISASHQLALTEDLYLADHHFVHAPGIKLLSACFPVLPMTMSLEVMAETAACLAPGCGLLSMEQVSAARWIALEDRDELPLRIEASVLGHDAARGQYRVAVAIHADGAATPSISAQAVLGTHYPPPAAMPTGAAPAATGTSAFPATVRDAAAAYAERHLFHGPRFQVLTGPVALDAQGAHATLLVRAPDQLFAAQSAPQLLLDPALLDGVGQLMALWSMQQRRTAFPIGIGQLSLHGPTPAAGTRVPVQVRVTGTQMKVLSADVDIGDGSGGVWMRISGWKSWQFSWDQRLIDLQRFPAQYLLSDAAVLPGAAPDAAGACCQRLTSQRVAGFDLMLLARHYLHTDEMPAYLDKAGQAPRQLQWLLGRVAAKDAARSWQRQRGGASLHPAAFAIGSDSLGQPLLRHWPAQAPVPHISIAHSGEQAIAVAHHSAVGIDIERIAEHDAAFLSGIAAPSEAALLDGVPANERAAWVTRLWCAKEALGKALSTGVRDGPRHYAAQALGEDGSLEMRHAGRATQVSTQRDGDWIIAAAFVQPQDGSAATL